MPLERPWRGNRFQQKKGRIFPIQNKQQMKFGIHPAELMEDKFKQQFCLWEVTPRRTCDLLFVDKNLYANNFCQLHKALRDFLQGDDFG
jgi:hypothetical protein